MSRVTGSVSLSEKCPRRSSNGSPGSMVRVLTVMGREDTHLHQPFEFTLTARSKLRRKGGCAADNRF